MKVVSLQQQVTNAGQKQDATAKQSEDASRLLCAAKMEAEDLFVRLSLADETIVSLTERVNALMAREEQLQQVSVRPLLLR